MQCGCCFCSPLWRCSWPSGFAVTQPLLTGLCTARPRGRRRAPQLLPHAPVPCAWKHPCPCAGALRSQCAGPLISLFLKAEKRDWPEGQGAASGSAAVLAGEGGRGGEVYLCFFPNVRRVIIVPSSNPISFGRAMPSIRLVFEHMYIIQNPLQYEMLRDNYFYDVLPQDLFLIYLNVSSFP